MSVRAKTVKVTFSLPADTFTELKRLLNWQYGDPSQFFARQAEIKLAELEGRAQETARPKRDPMEDTSYEDWLKEGYKEDEPLPF